MSSHRRSSIACSAGSGAAPSAPFTRRNAEAPVPSASAASPEAGQVGEP